MMQSVSTLMHIPPPSMNSSFLMESFEMGMMRLKQRKAFDTLERPLLNGVKLLLKKEKMKEEEDSIPFSGLGRKWKR